MPQNTPRANRMVTPLSRDNFFSILNYTKAKFTFPLHFHPEFELKLVMKARGKRIVGDSVADFEDDDLVLIGANTPHVWSAIPTGDFAHVVTIHFDPSSFLVEDFLGKTSARSLKELFLNSKRGVLFSKETIRQNAGKIIALASESRKFKNILNLLDLLHDLSISEGQTTLASINYKGQSNVFKSSRVQTVIDFIDENFNRKIMLSEVSDKVSMSDTAFSHFFKKATNRSFSDFLIDYRIGYASKLLMETDKSISEICFESGFSNLSNFNRIFKRKRGCTPKEFRSKQLLTRIF